MALFQKKTEFTSGAPLYTIGSNKTLLIVGLGNPESKYHQTRHNIGFEAIEYFAVQNNFQKWIKKNDLKCQINLANLGDSRVILCEPTTYMNESGQAVSAVQKFYRVYNQQTLVIYDELDLKFGQLRMRLGGSNAGHNGVKSLIAHIGDDFGRLRVGIANDLSVKADAADFVLGKFTKDEQVDLPVILKEANSMISEYVFGSQQFTPETRTVI